MLRVWGTSDCPKMIDIWLEILQHVYIIYIYIYLYMYMTMHTLQKNRFIMCIYRLYMYLSMNRKKHRFLWKIHGVPLNLTPSPSPLPGDCKCDIHRGWYMWICWKRGGTFPKFNPHTPFLELCCVLFFLAWISWVGQNAGKHHFASSECQLDLKVESCWNGGWFFSTWKRTRFLCWVTVHWTIGRKKGRC